MQISPRYDGEPLIDLAVDATGIRQPLLRQRRRLLATLAGLSHDQWRAPSRCADWTVQDVVTHLVSTDGFWTASLAGGLAGKPTRFLVGFDPKATPAALVDAAGGTDPAQTLADLTESTPTFCALVEGLGADGFNATAEAPPGHVRAHVVLHHALWDCWVHERDICLPLGIDVPEIDDEILACLRYTLALAPALSLMNGRGRPGVLVAEVSDPNVTVVATVGERVTVRPGPAPAGAPVLRGRAVDLVEALSVRTPLDHDLAENDRWLVEGMAEVFEDIA